jgi:dethiobiotin synthetase
MKGFFITGTDTDVGKTYVTARLARQYLAQGTQVAIRKPIASGCGNDLNHCADARYLSQASGEEEWLICPHRFSPSVSPARAMQESGTLLHLDDLVRACQQQTQDRLTLIEGAGGWLSPLTPNSYNANLALALQLPVVLVVANRLGCINHTLLTLYHIQTHGLTCPHLILNQTEPQSLYDAYHELQDHLAQSYPHTRLEKLDYFS